MRAFLSFRLPLWFVLPLISVVAVGTTIIGYVAATQINTPCTLSATECQKLSRFYDAWQIVSENYVDPKAASTDALVDGAITGLVDSLGDRGHSRYLSPKVADAERESLKGTFEGIGAYLSERDGFVIIAAPIPGTPAERAGIRPGDRILKVDGVDVRSDSVTDLQSKVRGPGGSTVQLEILHDDGSIEQMSITRASINIPSVTWGMLPNNVAHIHLNQFSSQAENDIKQALVAANQAGATHIILDLRNNPGGYVDQLMRVASQFLPRGSTVLIEEDRDGNRTPYTTDNTGLANNTPLVVLINGNSASAAEILAGSLQSAKRATIIGEPTFGTATVLRPFDLDEGAQIRLGTSQWLTPAGEVVRGKGINPDTLVALSNLSDIVMPAAAAQMDEKTLLTSSDEQLIEAYNTVLQQ
jgi:carboxyl-terminal processing protease